jgi:hypothetical protein
MSDAGWWEQFKRLLNGELEPNTQEVNITPEDQTKKPSMTVPSKDDLDSAAMHAMWPLPRVIPGPWNNSQREVDQANARCAKWREWVEAAGLSRAERSAYLGWISFCERDNAEAQDEVLTHRRRQELGRWNKQQNERLRRANAAKITKPDWKP